MRPATLVFVAASLLSAGFIRGDDQANRFEYRLQPQFHYRYEFELRSGEDGDGFLQLDGSVSYLAVPGISRPSLIDEAFKSDNASNREQSKPFDVRFSGIVNVKNAPARSPEGTLQVTPRGETIRLQGENDYSLVSTTTGSLAFDELPPRGETKWERTRNRDVTFVEETLGTPRGFALLRYGRYLSLSPAPLELTAQLNRYAIEDKLDYQVTEQSDKQLVVKTRLKSTWVNLASAKNTVALEGGGQYTFDRERQVISKGHSQHELKVTSEGIEARLPLKMAFVLRDVLSDEELKERVAKAAADRKAEQESRIAKAIAILKETTSSAAAVHDALQSLKRPGKAPEASQREVVASLLNEHLKSRDERTRWLAVEAAEDWATATNIPPLLELLKTEKSFRRNSIIQALGASGGNEQVATVLARLLETSSSSFRASQALEQLGPLAEPAVLPLLNSNEQRTRNEACRVLGEVGGKKSQLALEALMKQSQADDVHNFRLKAALEKINDRLATELD